MARDGRRHTMPDKRPIYRVNADRHSASRKVRYVEYSAGNDDCQLCQLDIVRFPHSATSHDKSNEPAPTFNRPSITVGSAAKALQEG